MKIRVSGIAESWELSITHLIELFFEEASVSFREEDHQPDLSIEVVVNADQVLHTRVELIDHRAGQTMEKSHSLEMQGDPAADPDIRKKTKRAISHTLLSVLQDYTGIEQPWGILTGVRPTKLMHRKLQQGESIERIDQELQDEYQVRAEKIRLMEQIVNRQLVAVPDLYQLKREVSIYIGIPFCPTKCAYCTFPAYAINGRQGSVDSFLGGLHYEMKQIGAWLKKHQVPITTVYFGGGTPTSITAEEMDMLYEEMYESFPGMEKVREVTVEAGRPDTITPDKLDVLKKWGIDRISINPQSYIQETLKAIGRHHTVEETIDKFKLAREMGMNNINMDLIIGLPGEGLEEFQHTLRETEKLQPESLTVHTLSFKRASEMTQNKEKYKVADREEITEMMKAATDWTGQNGYVPYYLYRQKNILGNLENIGYALPGKESIYNIMIMEEAQSIIGLGCGASSKWVHPETGKISRFANPKEPKAYNEGYEKYTQAKIDALSLLFGMKQLV